MNISTPVNLPSRRGGFTILELILVVLFVPVALTAVVVLGAYVPMLVLQAFGYTVSFWTVLYVHLLAILMGLGYTLVGRRGGSNQDGNSEKRGLFSIILGYVLNAVLQMLIFGSNGYEIGLVHILVAELPLVVLYRAVILVVRWRKGRASKKTEGSGLINPGDSTNT